MRVRVRVFVGEGREERRMVVFVRVREGARERERGCAPVCACTHHLRGMYKSTFCPSSLIMVSLSVGC